MGTPDFAVPALNRLINSKHKVVAVFTQAPKPKNRGHKLQKSPIHLVAEANNIEVFSPLTLKTEENQQLVLNIEADIIIVAAYGFIIPKSILEAKKYGCLNIHPSLLPRFRGAAPLQRTIIEGDKESAVCIMQMDEGLDTGDILLIEKFKLNRPTFSYLHDFTAELGAKMLLEVLDNADNLTPIKQTNDGLVYASKLSKEEGLINWNNSASTIDCQIRGMNPWPGTYINFNNNYIKILEAEPDNSIKSYKQPGTILSEDFSIACGENEVIKIKSVQLQGKKPQSAEEFLRGYSKIITIGTVL